MPFLPPAQFGRAKKRMQQGLHPAVLAALDRAINGTPLQQAPLAAVKPRPRDPGRYGTLAQQTAGAFNRGEIPLSLGSAVNKTATGGNVEAAQTRMGRHYDASIRRGPSGQLQEVHDYGGNMAPVVFTRKPSAALGERLRAANPTLGQHLSNSATAEDKLLAMATRQAAMGRLPSANVGTKRRFTRTPGMLRRY